VSGRAFAFALNQLIPPLVGALLLSTPVGPKYQVRAVVPGMGKDEKLFSNPGYGSPGFAV